MIEIRVRRKKDPRHARWCVGGFILAQGNSKKDWEYIAGGKNGTGRKTGKNEI